MSFSGIPSFLDFSGIDPAIATVPHLLDLLKTSRRQNTSLQDEVEEKTDKVRTIFTYNVTIVSWRNVLVQCNMLRHNCVHGNIHVMETKDVIKILLNSQFVSKFALQSYCLEFIIRNNIIIATLASIYCQLLINQIVQKQLNYDVIIDQ